MIGRSISLAGIPGAMLLAVVVVGVDAAASEVVVLKSGGRVEGDLVNRDRARTDPVIIVDETGVRLSLSASQVERVVVKKDVEKQYEDLLPSRQHGRGTLGDGCLVPRGGTRRPAKDSPGGGDSPRPEP
jgi:hypothetical protein